MLDRLSAWLAAAMVRLGRRPWIGVAVCVLVCAALAARAVGHVLEARVLADEPTAPRIPRIAPAADAAADEAAASPAARAQARARGGAALVARDMFCSSCAPSTAPPPGPMVEDGAGVPLTDLPLTLVATSLGHEPIATVRDERSGSQGAFAIGDGLPGAGPVTRIGATYVDFGNAATGREERVSLLAAAKAPGPGPGGGGPLPVDAAAADNPYADRVRKVDDTHYEVARALVRDLVGAAAKPPPGVRMMPIAKDGKLAGVRVIAARPDSVAGALGLKPGDTLGAVNGTPIDSLDAMLALYSKLDDLSVVTIDGTRAGKPWTMEYHLR